MMVKGIKKLYGIIFLHPFGNEEFLEFIYYTGPVNRFVLANKH
jgi:hypothetical protein